MTSRVLFALAAVAARQQALRAGSCALFQDAIKRGFQLFNPAGFSNESVCADYPGGGRNFMHAEEYDFRGWGHLPYCLSDFKTIPHRQGEIQNYHVWKQFFKLMKRVFAVSGFAAHQPLWVSGKQPSHTHANDFMVIHD